MATKCFRINLTLPMMDDWKKCEERNLNGTVQEDGSDCYECALNAGNVGCLLDRRLIDND